MTITTDTFQLCGSGITEEEAKQNGLREDMDSIRLGSDVGWEIWVEPLNFILKEGNRSSYFSAFKPLLGF